MQKTPKIAPTRKIAPFCPKNEEKYTERWSRRKKRMQKETLNPFFVVVFVHPKIIMGVKHFLIKDNITQLSSI